MDTFIKDTFTPVIIGIPETERLIDKFLESLEGKSKETRGTHQRCLRDFIRFLVSDKKFKYLVADVERYKHYLISEKNMAEVSMSQYLSSLRRFCSYLVESGILEKNPAKRVSGGKRPQKHSRQHITLDELQKLVDVVQGKTIEHKRDKAIIYLIIGCAVSELEISRMNVGDIVHHGGQAFVQVHGKGKNAKDSTVPIPQPVLAAIQSYLDARDSVTPDSALIESKGRRSRTKKLTIRALRQCVHNRLIESGIKHARGMNVTPFSLRHTAAVMLAEMGLSVEQLMKRLRLEWRPTAMIYIQQAGTLGIAS
ncbi:MAG: tyrosine-type recombinase/integrase, partial [Candidatus Kapabacteria bacterium]|nr:tyrosine-type recombinase/integrase [Candidatus Kapabacteria bacterium]